MMGKGKKLPGAETATRGDAIGTTLGWSLDFPMEPLGDFVTWGATKIPVPTGIATSVSSFLPSKSPTINIDSYASTFTFGAPGIETSPNLPAPINVPNLEPGTPLMTKVTIGPPTNANVLPPNFAGAPVPSPINISPAIDTSSNIVINEPASVASDTSVPPPVGPDVPAPINPPSNINIDESVNTNITENVTVPPPISITVPTPTRFSPFPAFLAGIDLTKGLGGKRVGRASRKRKLGYTPSFKALALGITAKEKPLPTFGNVFTGGELRPIILTEEQQKKKKKKKGKRPNQRAEKIKQDFLKLPKWKAF